MKLELVENPPLIELQVQSSYSLLKGSTIVMDVLGLTTHGSQRTGFDPDKMCKKDERDGFVYFGSEDDNCNDFVI